MAAPQIRSLDSIKQGDGEAATLVATVLRRSPTLVAGLNQLADECLVSEWTVYRWLRGKHEPRTRQLARLRWMVENPGHDEQRLSEPMGHGATDA